MPDITRKNRANAIRFLSMDAVQKANSGHPGLPMGCAEFGAYLYGVYLSVAVGYVGEDEVAGTIKEQQEKFDRMVDAYDRTIDRAMLSIKLREYQTDDERKQAISKMIMNKDRRYVSFLVEVVRKEYPGMVEFVEKVMLLA